MDIVEKLRLIAELKTGDPFPEMLTGGTQEWGSAMSVLLWEAIEEIEELRGRIDILYSEPH